MLPVPGRPQTGLYLGNKAPYAVASDGKWAAYFGSTTANGGASIAQTLTTTASQVYVLTFDLASDNGGLAPTNDFIATVAGAPVFTTTNLPSPKFCA